MNLVLKYFAIHIISTIKANKSNFNIITRSMQSNICRPSSHDDDPLAFDLHLFSQDASLFEPFEVVAHRDHFIYDDVPKMAKRGIDISRISLTVELNELFLFIWDESDTRVEVR